MRSVVVLAWLALGVTGGCARHDGDEAWRAQLAAWRFPAPLPDFPLVDETVRALSLRDPTPTLVAFAFSRCAVPEACPRTLERFRELEAAATPARLVIVTIDPSHDTPAVLASWKARAGLARTTFATGAGDRPADVVEALASTVNVTAIGTAPALSHPVKAVLLAPDGAPVQVWPDNTFDATAVEAAVRRAVAKGEARASAAQ